MSTRWENKRTMDSLLSLAKKLCLYAEDYHFVAIGQSPYYPLFAANCLAITQRGPLSYSIIPFSSNITVDAQYEGIKLEADQPLYFSSKPKDEMPATVCVQAMQNRLGMACDTARLNNKTPLILDMFAAGSTFASVALMLSWYDRENSTSHFNDAVFLRFMHKRHYAADNPELNIKDTTTIKLPALVKMLTTVFVENRELLEQIAETDNHLGEGSERVVPYCPPKNWHLSLPLRPEGGTPAEIKRHIQAAIANHSK